jgi:hypothetical protein
MIVRELFSFHFWAVEMFFSCVLYDFTILLCCLLGFRSNRSTLPRMIEECDKKVLFKYQESCTFFWSVGVNAMSLIS